MGDRPQRFAREGYVIFNRIAPEYREQTLVSGFDYDAQPGTHPLALCAHLAGLPVKRIDADVQDIVEAFIAAGLAQESERRIVETSVGMFIRNWNKGLIWDLRRAVGLPSQEAPKRRGRRPRYEKPAS